MLILQSVTKTIFFLKKMRLKCTLLLRKIIELRQKKEFLRIEIKNK